MSYAPNSRADVVAALADPVDAIIASDIEAEVEHLVAHASRLAEPPTPSDLAEMSQRLRTMLRIAITAQPELAPADFTLDAMEHLIGTTAPRTVPLDRQQAVGALRTLAGWMLLEMPERVTRPGPEAIRSTRDSITGMAAIRLISIDVGETEHDFGSIRSAIHGITTLHYAINSTPSAPIAYEFLSSVGAVRPDPDVDSSQIDSLPSLARAIAAPLLVGAVELGYPLEPSATILSEAALATLHGSLIGLNPLVELPAVHDLSQGTLEEACQGSRATLAYAAECVGTLLALSIPEAENPGPMSGWAAIVARQYGAASDEAVFADPVFLMFDMAHRFAALWGIDVDTWIAPVPDDDHDSRLAPGPGDAVH